MSEEFSQGRICKKFRAGCLVNIRQDVPSYRICLRDPAQINTELLIANGSGERVPSLIEFICQRPNDSAFQLDREGGLRIENCDP